MDKEIRKNAFRYDLIRIQTADEANQIRQLTKQVEDLKQALGQVTLEKLKLESVLEEYETDNEKIVKKKKFNNPKTLG